MKRVFIMMLDSFGIGFSHDAEKFGDKGSDTLGHIAEQCALGKADNAHRQGKLHLPNFEKLGLGLAAQQSTGKLPAGFSAEPELMAGYAYAQEISSGKDTPSGHWEIAGVPVLFDWGYFPEHQNSFPQELLDRIVEKAGLTGYLGNCHSSGTVILDELGEEHIQSGKPIFYTSADSVFQIACHEESYGLEKLYELCQIVREELEGYNIGRVIARPFLGDKVGEFYRTGNRKDYAVEPPAKTVLQKLVDEKQGEVISIGKIADIYAHTGITQKVKATGIEELFDKTLTEIKSAVENSIVFTNFVNFDSDYGHRRNVAGYAAALEYFDSRIPELLALMNDDDLLIFTADHGCDPTWSGTDHTREHIPVLIYGSNVPKQFLGKRQTFADVGQTIASYFELSPMDYGTSILE
ncbi:phosphopentomutase [Canicola haemoglobinophilus]|uniref:Phosphopentomutase n=1 Tax=Canicola haemoglobinophilus TaxID=733 RepID=A0A1V4AYI4_9PAST|nr:phosphopentomutase [Canicola haemoglobinophilus]OOR96852.1 phosphopentomutase [Canicola haemoglobinophilus]STO59797.1 Phosphopentomutase [Canicola haemoglobinophilus]